MSAEETGVLSVRFGIEQARQIRAYAVEQGISLSEVLKLAATRAKSGKPVAYISTNASRLSATCPSHAISFVRETGVSP